MQRVRDFK
jgi:hypothetical protein